jgi:hypothetical protein
MFTLHVLAHVNVHVHIHILKCQTVRHPVNQVLEFKKLTILEQVRYQPKLTQSGIFLVQYWTRIQDWNADAGVSFHDADAQLWTS